MNSELAGIKYVKVVRDCPHNTKLIEQGTEGRVIYDYDVYKGGKRIATFKREVGSIRYRLHDADNRQIRIPETIRVYIAMSRKDCDRILKAALEADAIPSEEFIAKRREQEAQAEVLSKELESLQAIKHRKEDKAEEMYDIIQAIIDSTMVPIELMSRINSVALYVKETE